MLDPLPSLNSLTPGGSPAISLKTPFSEVLKGNIMEVGDCFKNFTPPCKIILQVQKKHYSFNFQLSRGRLSFPRVSKGSKRRVRRGRADQTEKQQQDKGWAAADLPGYCHMCTTLQHFSTLHLSPKLLSLADIALHSTSAKYYLALVPSLIL